MPAREATASTLGEQITGTEPENYERGGGASAGASQSFAAVVSGGTEDAFVNAATPALADGRTAVGPSSAVTTVAVESVVLRYEQFCFEGVFL